MRKEQGQAPIIDDPPDTYNFNVDAMELRSR
jgi:hypothetical protein